MAASLTPAQRQELKQAFDTIDAGIKNILLNINFHSIKIDGSGKISERELGNIFKALNIKISDSELKNVVAEMDKDKSGMFNKLILIK